MFNLSLRWTVNEFISISFCLITSFIFRRTECVFMSFIISKTYFSLRYQNPFLFYTENGVSPISFNYFSYSSSSMKAFNLSPSIIQLSNIRNNKTLPNHKFNLHHLNEIVWLGFVLSILLGNISELKQLKVSNRSIFFTCFTFEMNATTTFMINWFHHISDSSNKI